jgi:predicted nicotinamide N-methyase
MCNRLSRINNFTSTDENCLKGMFGYDSDSSGPPVDEEELEDALTTAVEITRFTSKHFNTDIVIETNKVKGIAHQLWPAAFLLCKYLEENREIYFSCPSSTSVVELGAGVGLGGILAGMFGCRTVLITDLAEAMPLIEKNITHNQALFPHPNNVHAAVLQWGDSADHLSRTADLHHSASSTVSSPPTTLVIAADCVYWEHLYEPFYQTLLYFVCELGATVVLSHVKRWKRERKFFTLVSRRMRLEVLFETVEMVPDEDPHCKAAPPPRGADVAEPGDNGGQDTGGTAEHEEEETREGGTHRLRRQVSRVYRLTKKEE